MSELVSSLEQRYVVVHMRKVIHGNFLFLVALFKVKMHCANSTDNSEVSLNSKIFYSNRQKVFQRPLGKSIYLKIIGEDMEIVNLAPNWQSSIHWIFFLRMTLMNGLLLLVTGRALLMSPKGRNASRDGLV